MFIELKREAYEANVALPRHGLITLTFGNSASKDVPLTHVAAVTLTKRPAGALKLTKKLMRDHERIAAQISEESQLFKERLKTPEAREAFAAFAERRPPDFSKVA